MKSKKGNILLIGLVLTIAIIFFFILSNGQNSPTLFSSKEEKKLNDLNISCKAEYDIYMEAKNLQRNTYLVKSVWLENLEELKTLEKNYGSNSLGFDWWFGPSEEIEKITSYEPNYGFVINYEGNEHYGPLVAVCICRGKQLIC